jgi:hypothetical protein
MKRRVHKRAVATKLPPLSELKAKELNRKVTVVEDGVERHVRVIELIFRQIATAAAGGSHAAIKTIIDIKAAIDAAAIEPPEPEPDLTEPARKMLERAYRLRDAREAYYEVQVYERLYGPLKPHSRRRAPPAPATLGEFISRDD